jgi:ABC transporter substrate binding protein
MPWRAVAAFKQATASIPIVFAIAVDPVGVGLVSSLARPGGNVIGSSLQGPDLAGKRLEFLREVVPGSAGWQRCLMPAMPHQCWRAVRFRLRLARSASKSRHSKLGEWRISRLSSRFLPIWTQGTAVSATVALPIAKLRKLTCGRALQQISTNLSKRASPCEVTRVPKQSCYSLLAAISELKHHTPDV